MRSDARTRQVCERTERRRHSQQRSSFLHKGFHAPARSLPRAPQRLIHLQGRIKPKKKMWKGRVLETSMQEARSFSQEHLCAATSLPALTRPIHGTSRQRSAWPTPRKRQGGGRDEMLPIEGQVKSATPGHPVPREHRHAREDGSCDNHHEPWSCFGTPAGRSDALDGERQPHAYPNAQGGDSAFPARFFKLMHQRHCDAGAGHA